MTTRRQRRGCQREPRRQAGIVDDRTLTLAHVGEDAIPPALEQREHHQVRRNGSRRGGDALPAESCVRRVATGPGEREAGAEGQHEPAAPGYPQAPVPRDCLDLGCPFPQQFGSHPGRPSAGRAPEQPEREHARSGHHAGLACGATFAWFAGCAEARPVAIEVCA
jgi:hypothetical protein